MKTIIVLEGRKAVGKTTLARLITKPEAIIDQPDLCQFTAFSLRRALTTLKTLVICTESYSRLKRSPLFQIVTRDKTINILKWKIERA